MYHQIRRQTTLILHAAWPVNFNLSLTSFEPHIAGLHNLLQLALDVPWRHPAAMLFASSISTAMGAPRGAGGEPATVAEAPVPSLDWAQATGYARSKLVGERICEAAATRAGARVGVLRIGQIAGDSARGVRNDKEAVPLMVRSALALGVLPLLNGEKGICEWIPVDTAARACLDVASIVGDPAAALCDVQGEANGHVNGTSPCQTTGSNASNVNDANCPGSSEAAATATYYNIGLPHAFSWNDAVLPGFKDAGLDFQTVLFPGWLAKLRAQAGGSGHAEQQIPALKLSDYYEGAYGDKAEEAPAVRFSHEKGWRDVAALRECPNIGESGLIGKFLHAWMRRWQ